MQQNDALKGKEYALLSIPVGELTRPALIVSPTTSIQDTAKQMTATDSHTALIVDATQLCGIVTDQNFRARVIAAERSPFEPISHIMTHNPIRLPSNASASEAMTLMASHNIRHIPIINPRDHSIHGVVAATDLLRTQSHNAIYLIGDIHLAKDVATLQHLSTHIPQALVAMVNHDMAAYHIAHTISSIGQAIIRRLLQLAEQTLGAPPIAYAFIVAGSLARFEQTAHTDQDNGLLLADSFKPEQHDAYFAALANFVSDGLNNCGYSYCPGGIMASNPKWRQPLSTWLSYFRHWIEVPDPESLLFASIFFDLRCLHGDSNLLEQLRADILARTKTHPLFQTLLAANALTFTPPLGFFKQFVTEKHADNTKVIDLKKRGVTPVIDLARVYTLALGLTPLNTHERLELIAQRDARLNQSRLADLKDAYEYICRIRLQQQAKQITAGRTPNHYVQPSDLSALEQRYLKAAFEVVAETQELMSQHYQSDKIR